jgi:hypothetical protein
MDGCDCNDGMDDGCDCNDGIVGDTE